MSTSSRGFRSEYTGRIAWYAGIWVVVVLFTTTQLVLTYTSGGGPPYWSATLRNSALQWLPWLVLAPGIVAFTPRLWAAYPRRVPVALAHVVAVLFVAAAIVALSFALRSMSGSPIKRTYVAEYLRNVHSIAFIYVLLAAGALIAASVRRTREREAHVARLEVQLADARFASLQAQLHPHFLFNTLHGVTSLIHEDPDAAEDMLTALSDLLRITLARSDQREVVLRDDIGFLERYLEIHQMRLGDRLRVEIDVSPEAMDCTVPAFVIQPLAENAIRYAIAPRREGGTLRIGGAVRAGTLCLAVSDDGPGLALHGAREAPSGWGIGLENTRARLSQLFGDRHHFAASTAAGGGAVIEIEIPARTSNIEVASR